MIPPARLNSPPPPPILNNQKDQVFDFFVNVMKCTVWLLCSIFFILLQNRKKSSRIIHTHARYHCFKFCSLGSLQIRAPLGLFSFTVPKTSESIFRVRQTPLHQTLLIQMVDHFARIPNMVLTQKS